jgi:hypothetical protein
MQVNLKDGTLERVHELLPIPLHGRDLDFIVDWLVGIGCKTTRKAMDNNPGVTLGQLMASTISQENAAH